MSVALIVFVAAGARANENDQARNAGRLRYADYIRVEKNARGTPIALQTSVIPFEAVCSGSYLRVDLIGTVHVADGEYYAQLNQEFRSYDALLYELIAPSNVRSFTRQVDTDWASEAQERAAAQLGLVMQKEAIDYRAENFVHADMNVEEFGQALHRRGISLQRYVSRMGEAELDDVLGRPETIRSFFDSVYAPVSRELLLKRAMAPSLADLEVQAEALAREPASDVILAHRGAKTLAVLRAQLRAGRRNLGIFFGAAHMPHLAHRLIYELGLRPKTRAIRWHTAWNLH